MLINKKNLQKNISCSSILVGKHLGQSKILGNLQQHIKQQKKAGKKIWR